MSATSAASPRQVFLDTETTGLDPADGHRIIEVAAIEVANRRLTGRRFHAYLDPGRDSDPAALEIHGLTREFLSDKPGFATVVPELLDFIRDAELIMHNADFDTRFLDSELGRAGLPPLAEHCACITDSWRLARELHPGRKNGLDMLCERYGIDRSARVKHGALIDAELLARVYLAMTRGQDSLTIDLDTGAGTAADDGLPLADLGLEVRVASAEELAAHEAMLAGIDRASKGRTLWRLPAGT